MVRRRPRPRDCTAVLWREGRVPCCGPSLEAVSCCMDLPLLCPFSRVRPGTILCLTPHHHQHFFSQDTSHISPGLYVGTRGLGTRAETGMSVCGEGNRMWWGTGSPHSPCQQEVSLAWDAAKVRGRGSQMRERVCLKSRESWDRACQAEKIGEELSLH